MANPFPGMDPYLEGDLWTTVHFFLSAEIARSLAPRLRPKYFVFANQQYVAAEATGDEDRSTATDRMPDVAVTGPGGETGGSTAVAVAPLVSKVILPDPEQQITVEVRDRAERRLVTAIEVLSPSIRRGPGLRDYVVKREQYLRSPAHLLEIDLLRSGRRFPVTDPLPRDPYFVFLSRAGRRPEVEIWPVAFDQPLPTVPVPLLPGDADVPLDLQSTLNDIHELYSYADAVDYTQPPARPLPPGWQDWADERLRVSRLRP